MLPQLHRQPWMDSDIETFRDQVRRYIAAEMAPHLPAWREQGYVPRETWRPFGEMGFMAARNARSLRRHRGQHCLPAGGTG